MERTSAQKPSKINASKHSLHSPPFQGHKKSIRNSLFSNSLSKMLHFFSMKFATTLDFTGFPVISHVVTHIPRLTHTFDIYSGSPQIRNKAGSHVIIHDLRLVLLILHCPYTQINSSLRFIFSLLFLNNPLIDLKPFMNG